MLAPWKKSYDKPRQCIKKQREQHHFANKGLYGQSYGFSSSHVWMWELDHKEGWMPKNWYFWAVVLEKTPESPLDSKEIQPVNPKGNQPWIFIGRIDAEAEAPILRPPDAKSWLIGKDFNAGKDWVQEERGQQRKRSLDGINDSMDMSLSKFQEIVEDKGAWCATVRGVTKNWIRLSSWTTTTVASNWLDSLMCLALWIHCYCLVSWLFGAGWGRGGAVITAHTPAVTLSDSLDNIWLLVRF